MRTPPVTKGQTGQERRIDNDVNVQDLGNDDSSDEGTDRTGVDEEEASDDGWDDQVKHK